MDLRGWLEMIFQSRCQREPVRYQWGTYDSMYEEWMHSINLGGTAEVYYGFCPCMGQKPFFMLALRLTRHGFEQSKRKIFQERKVKYVSKL
jgi:hypothetical protein